MERIIFDNTGTDFEEAKKELIQSKIDSEIEFNESEISDTEVYDFISDIESFWFDSEWENLNTEINPGIIALADLGFWNGRRYGYKEVGYNLKSILHTFSNCDYIKFFYDTKDRQVKGQGSHHDGTHYVTFRKWKDDISDEMRDKTLNAIYDNADNAESLIKRYTTGLGKEVKNIYGW